MLISPLTETILHEGQWIAGQTSLDMAILQSVVMLTYGSQWLELRCANTLAPMDIDTDVRLLPVHSEKPRRSSPTATTVAIGICGNFYLKRNLDSCRVLMLWVKQRLEFMKLIFFTTLRNELSSHQGFIFLSN